MRLSLLTAVLLACTPAAPVSGDDPDTSTDDDSEILAPANRCNEYLSCLSELFPNQFADVLDQYGENGSCWDGDAELCDQACSAGLEATRETLDFDEPYPDSCLAGLDPEPIYTAGDWETLFEEPNWVADPPPFCPTLRAPNFRVRLTGDGLLHPQLDWIDSAGEVVDQGVCGDWPENTWLKMRYDDEVPFVSCRFEAEGQEFDISGEFVEGVFIDSYWVEGRFLEGLVLDQVCGEYTDLILQPL